MSHLLSTTNPEAAAALQNGEDPYRAKITGNEPQGLNQKLAQEAAPPEPVEVFEEWRNFPLPPVGEIVIYLPPPGQGRSGRSEFPAFVMAQHIEQHTVDLLVIFGVDDLVDRLRIPHCTPNHPAPAFKERLQPGEPRAPAIGLLGAQPALQQISQEIDELGLKIFGPFERPNKSVIEFLADFEDTLKGIKKRLKVLEKAAGQT